MEFSATTLNLASIVSHHAKLAPQREAIIWGEIRMTYGQLDALSNRVARGLVELGIGRGDKVALSCPNLPFFPVVYYGIMKAGAAVVPLNVLFKPREVAYHLKDSDAKAVFVFEGTDELPMKSIHASIWLSSQRPVCSPALEKIKVLSPVRKPWEM
jgi:long-chain acyl-CoA synthetase